MSIPNLHSIFINGAEIKACIACAMGIATSDPDMEAIATAGCEVCGSTMPPAPADETAISEYIKVLKHSGTFKASIFHIESHMGIHQEKETA